ncbi:hypothetical protein AINA4_01480 [Aurantimicrobium sp. INA4]|nr:hypothetical protein AINA4_01480 [Aurantimicrobium sp. INA4]
MSFTLVSLTFVGSIVCVKVWVVEPAETTGMDAVKSTVEPGATLVAETLNVTASTA